jgi:hypothetical protein
MLTRRGIKLHLHRNPGRRGFASAAIELPRPILLAQNMEGMGSAGMGGGPAGMSNGRLRPRLPSGPSSMSDAPSMGLMGWPNMSRPMGSQAMQAPMASPPAATPGTGGPTFVPLGSLADIRVVGGPTMVRDEAGLLVG